MSDLISIITPSYNRAHLLPQTIESVLEQTYSFWELIIIDDGSTDNTEKIVKKYSDKNDRIKYLYQENSGISVARNFGIKNAVGKYLTFLDSDDLYLPSSLKNLWEYFRRTPPQTKLVYGDFVHIDYKGKTIQIKRPTPPQARPNLYFQFLISGFNPIAPCATMVEKNAIINLGMFDESFSSVEDRELWTRLILKYDIEKIDTQVAKYRKHEDQLTKNMIIRRYNGDRAALNFFNSLNVSELFPGGHSEHEMSIHLERLAKYMLNRSMPTYDTALHILKVAQKINNRPKRERYIEKLDKKIKELLDKSVLSI